MIKKWLLLRGLARSQEHWLDFPEIFRGKDMEPYLLDLPGVGENKHIKTPLSIASQAKKMREQWLQMKSEDDQWGIIGLSLGGMIALEWCAQFPLDFQKMVVINTSAAGLGGGFVRLSTEAMHTLARAGVIQDIRLKESLISGLVSNVRKEDPSLLDSYESIARETPISGATAATQLAAAARFRAPKAISTPMLVLSSSKDRLCPPVFSELIAKKYGAHHEIHHEAGHDLPLDDPNWVADQVFDFSRK